MSERPTPETDAETNYCDAMPDMPWVDAEVARKLERERDEVMAKYATEATDHMLAVNKLCNERDEAREVLREIAAADWKTSGELRGMACKALEVAK